MRFPLDIMAMCFQSRFEGVAGDCASSSNREVFDTILRSEDFYCCGQVSHTACTGGQGVFSSSGDPVFQRLRADELTNGIHSHYASVVWPYALHRKNLDPRHPLAASLP